MKKLFLVLFLLYSQNLYSQDYDVFDDEGLIVTTEPKENSQALALQKQLTEITIKQVKTENELANKNKEVIQAISLASQQKNEYDNLKLEHNQIEENYKKLEESYSSSEEDYEQLKLWYDTYIYLFGTTGLTVAGFISRVLYVLYQTKTGKLLVKHIKNDVKSLEDDIVNNIVKITDLETGEDLRKRLRSVQSKLLEIAKQKLPPSPTEYRN